MTVDKLDFVSAHLHCEADDYPLGGSQRGTAIFMIESHPKKGERCVRVTVNAAGRKSKPKTTTYAGKTAILRDASGRHWIARDTSYGFVSIMRSDMKIEHASVHKSEDPERYSELIDLIYNAS